MAILEEVESTFEDIKGALGDKGFLIFIGVAVAFGLYNLTKGSGSENNLVPVTSVSSYPDAVTNADVIIDSVQNSIDYSENNIMDAITNLGEATNDYINSGLDSANKTQQESTNEIIGSINNSTDTIINNNNDIQNAVNEIKSELNKVNFEDSEAMKNATLILEEYKTEIEASKPATPTTTTTKNNSGTFYSYTSKAGLNTNTSIVDALKATGVDSSFANRSKIAKANGITNYTGTYQQNVTLLNKLKSGTLKKV